MKLINADLFLKEIINRCGCIPYIEGKNGETIYLNELIKEQPVAYDVDSVMEKLNQSENGILLAMEEMSNNPNVSPENLFLVGNSNLIMLSRYKQIVESGWNWDAKTVVDLSDFMPKRNETKI